MRSVGDRGNEPRWQGEGGSGARVASVFDSGSGPARGSAWRGMARGGLVCFSFATASSMSGAACSIGGCSMIERAQVVGMRKLAKEPVNERREVDDLALGRQPILRRDKKVWPLQRQGQ